MRLRRAIAIAVVCATGLFVAAPAVAATQNPIVQDCLLHRKGLTGHYTVAQLRHALKVMPQYTQEYTSCPDVINRALLAQLSIKPGHGGSGSFLPVPLLIILAVVVVAGAGFAAQAARNRRRPDR